ncbi:MAG: FAD-dependent oxidoreductase [Clostridiales bacterium]|nr:FAD-dependent oxidoreductase [Clostridiales bacterium]
MYSEEMLQSVRRVEAARAANMGSEPSRMTAAEKEALLKEFHPDYRDTGFGALKAGVSAGDKAPTELLELLEGKSRVLGLNLDLNNPDYDVDVLVIGGGGAGSSAAIEAHEAGASVMVVTKLRLGDANTMMAEGGIQAADKPNDSPAQHYLDAFGGGHYAAVPELLKKLVMDGPGAVKWLNGLGVEFDKDEDGTMVTTHGGGTSRKRMHAAADYSGAEIMRTLRDEVLNREIPVVDFTAAIELLLDTNGHAAGAVLLNMETGEHRVARAKTVVLATGGAGRLHYQGFPTSNHYGATADGLVLGYRAGAPLLYADTLQYHPTGAAFPLQIYGALVTEKVRSMGAMLVNANGEAFMHPLETRDVSAASIIRECKERGNGIKTPEGSAVWLDTPMIDLIHGAGTLEKRLPGMLRMFMKYDIDMRVVPILVYPTLHYQNGGLRIDARGETAVRGLFVAGEAVGGIHGRNRLMGNSLLDIIVFGRTAGKSAASDSRGAELAELSLGHVRKYMDELEAAGAQTGVESPKLLPHYANKRP